MFKKEKNEKPLKKEKEVKSSKKKKEEKSFERLFMSDSLLSKRVKSMEKLNSPESKAYLEHLMFEKKERSKK